MFYFEHYLGQCGVRSLSTVCILKTTDEAWVYRDLRAEILDLYPQAIVREADPAAALPPCDLLIAPFMEPYRFPFHDVLYEELHQLRRLLPLRGSARHVMLYRARWREVEVVRGSGLAARVRKRRLEGLLIGWCRRSAFIRRLLRPLY